GPRSTSSMALIARRGSSSTPRAHTQVSGGARTSRRAWRSSTVCRVSSWTRRRGRCRLRRSRSKGTSFGRCTWCATPTSCGTWRRRRGWNDMVASLKGALEVFTRYLAEELGSRGITVNAVAPGAIATDFSGGIVRDNPAVNKLVAGMTALGRVGVPDDIGPVIASLLSDDNHWVTGQRIEASGGMVL